MIRFSLHRVALLVLATLLFTIILSAQSDLGTITGLVKDPSGAMIPNANVLIRNEATGIERQTISSDTGYYIFINLPPAIYTIAVDATGFKRFETRGIKLDPNSTRAVDANLTVGAATETVEVSAQVTALQSESATVQKLITQQQMEALELNGRNPVFLAQLQPGVRGGALAGLNYGLSLGPSAINGARNQETLITFDGAPAVRTRSNGTSIGVADVDSTQEVQVLTANYGAEYGRSAGGQIRIVTKSGTRDFHGNLFEYFRNDALNANSWTRNNSPTTAFVSPFHWNQFGYNASGPVWYPGAKFNKERNKLFWYWGQEWTKYHYLESVFRTVPTAAMRAGDFSELLTPNPFYSGTRQLYDPTTCPSVGAAGCQAIPGNKIPATLLSKNGLGLFNAYPTPNLPNYVNGNNNWYGGAAHPIDTRKDTLSIDILPSDKHRIMGRRQNYKYMEFQPFDGGLDVVPKWFNRPNQTNSIDYVWTISPTVVNEALATFSLDGVYMPLDLSSGRYDRTKAGINYPYLFPDGKEVPNRVPTLALSSPIYDLNGGPYPSHSSGPIYTFSDSLTWIKGAHTLKFGFAFEYSGQNDFDQINVSGVPGGTNNQNGRFAFSDARAGAGATSGLSLGNAAMGLFDVYSEIGRRSYTLYRGKMFEGFAQDSWKVNRKLNLTYGVRYTVIVPYHAIWRNMDVFDPKYYDPAKAVKQDPKTGYIIPGSGDPYNGIVIPGDGVPDYVGERVFAFTTDQYNYLFRGESDHYSDVHYNQFQPRVGIAYNLNDKTVIRTGAGRFFTRLGVSDSVFLGGNSPFQPIVSVSNGNVDNPGGGSQNMFPLTITTQSRAFKNPESWAWNFTVEREAFWKSVVSVAYVGRRGLHLQQERDLNALPVGTLKGPNAIKGVNTDYLRPYKGFATIRQTDNVGTSTYNSLQLNWTRRFTNGFAFGAAYTLSKSMDDGSAQRDILPNANDRAAMWGPSSFDSRHIIVINYIYELPFLRNQASLLGKLAGGWQISGLTQFQTGTPCSVALGNDYAGVGTLGSMNCDGSVAGQLWNVNGDVNYTQEFALNNADPHYWFQPKNTDGSAMFTAPADGTFTTQKNRGLIYHPGFQNWNIGLFKKFAINERTGFQFRAEAFNFINHPNWGNVQLNPTSSTFGKVTSKSSERNLQLSLRFYF
jgi:hypothetical protein